MRIAMIGLGRMGANMVLRLLQAGHEVVVWDHSDSAIQDLTSKGAIAATDPNDLVSKLTSPKALWMMIPAAYVDESIATFAPLLGKGDILIDGGNSYYKDDIRRSQKLATQGISYVDVGTSGGVWGLERGYCEMIGGSKEAVAFLDPILKTLAPGKGDIEVTPSRTRKDTTAEEGYLHCGPSGAGHFVKMVHNGIEYGMMAAYSEGLNILKHANVGKATQEIDAETTPLREPQDYQYDLDLPEIAEVWRRGSVVASWLLDLTADAMARDPDLASFGGRVSDSGEGRWTIEAAIDEGVPAPVLTTALYQRFSSRSQALFADKVCSAMRFEFGGHHEKPEGSH
jgi:6-phosphogluconate dehydrogenase